MKQKKTEYHFTSELFGTLASAVQGKRTALSKPRHKPVNNHTTNMCWSDDQACWYLDDIETEGNAALLGPLTPGIGQACKRQFNAIELRYHNADSSQSNNMLHIRTEAMLRHAGTWKAL